MSNYYEIVAALVMALVITIFFSAVLRHKGPWGAVWLVFVTIFLASWAGYLWINPFGPMVLGVSIAPIFVVGLIFAFILAAVSVPQPRFKRKTPETEEADSATVAIGIFFWIVLIILIVAIAAGYYRLPVNSEQIVN
jgi:small-conductance mechanosensitive channel